MKYSDTPPGGAAERQPRRILGYARWTRLMRAASRAEERPTPANPGPRRMRPVVFIAGLAHSGSTPLALLLGSHSRFLALGEVAELLKPNGLEASRGAVCSCGKAIDGCEFWRNLASRLAANDGLGAAMKYRLVLEHFDGEFGRDVIPVDSSKYLKHLRLILDIDAVDAKVILLLKDVRAYTISHIDNARRRKLRRREHLAAYHFWRWYRDNRSFQQFLRHNRVPYFQLGYEELSLYPDEMVARLCAFLEVDVEPAMLEFRPERSHVMRGNRMRTQAAKNRRLLYDHRWLYRSEWLVPALLFPRILRYNAREVYGNESGATWQQ